MLHCKLLLYGPPSSIQASQLRVLAVAVREKGRYERQSTYVLYGNARPHIAKETRDELESYAGTRFSM